MSGSLVRWNDLLPIFEIRYFRYVNKAKHPYFKGAFLVIYSGQEFEIRKRPGTINAVDIWGPPAVNFGAH
jgi:hypothetical protein